MSTFVIPVGKKRCITCRKILLLKYFKAPLHQCKNCVEGNYYKDRYGKRRKDHPAENSLTKTKITKNFRLRMCISSKGNAKRKKISHTIVESDIPKPKVCCYLGIELNYNQSLNQGGMIPDNTATLDRIDSTKGYDPGNIQVISWLANRMKTNATIEQLQAFAKGILRNHP